MSATTGRRIGRALAIGAASLLIVASGAADDEQTRWEYLSGKYDADDDGRITRKEYTRDDVHWKRLDANGDGVLTEAEIDGGGRQRGRRGREGRGRRERGSGGDAPRPVAPKVGVMAPDFHLDVIEPPRPETEGEEAPKEKKKEPERILLSSFRGKQPVALIFGSYT